MPTIKGLREDATMSLSELARLANVDYQTAKKADNSQKVTRTKLLQLLRVLNEKLGTSYRVDDLEQPHN